MKQLFYILIFSFLFSSVSVAQCTIDTSHFVGKKYTYPDTLPCAIKGAMYDTTVQVKVPRTVLANEFFPTYPAIQVTVDSVKIDSITNLPDSLFWSMNPTTKVIKAPGYGCFSVYGKVLADTGNYSIGVWGTTWFKVFGKDTFQKGNFSAVFPVNIRVIDSGAICYYSTDTVKPIDTTQVGIQSISDFNYGIEIYPTSTADFVRVKVLNLETTISSVEIFNRLGMKVESFDWSKTQQEQIFSVKHLSSGVYILKILSNGRMATRRFVRE